MINQILMAAARGARIQVKDRFGWKDEVISVRIKDDFYAYRIHPDDEHLRFGPISTALRECAMLGSVHKLQTDFDWMARLHLINNIPATRMPPTIEQRSLFLLILSEALADSGL